MYNERTCVLCNAKSKRARDLCMSCEKDLNHLEAQQTIPNVFALYNYQNPVDHLITSLKFNHQLMYAKLLGELFSDFLEEKYSAQKKPEIIIPIPLHHARLRERGFNQALEIARPIAKQLKIPIDKFCCMRTKNTAAQTTLSVKDRHQNVKNAFAIVQSIKYKHVAIIDDVMTTGSTIGELNKILHQNGAEKIDIWCCARA